jgi:hypothetical protein
MQIKDIAISILTLILIPVLLTTFYFIICNIEISGFGFGLHDVYNTFVFYVFSRLIFLWFIPFTYHLFFRNNTLKSKIIGAVWIFFLINFLIYIWISNEYPLQIRESEKLYMYISYNSTAIIIYALYKLVYRRKSKLG